jgi:hypothetical protein
MLRRVALVRTGVSGEIIALFIRVTRVAELRNSILHGISSQRASVASYCLRCSWLTDSCHLDDGRDIFPKCRFLQEPHGVTSQKTPFFIVTAVKTSNLT